MTMRPTTSPSWHRASASPSRRWAPASPFLEVSREEQLNKMRTWGGAAGEDLGGGEEQPHLHPRACCYWRWRAPHGEELGRKMISFFLRGKLWNMLEMSFFTEHQSAGPTILFPVFPHAEWGSLGESLSGRGHGCSFIYAYVLIFFFLKTLF
jgi:hypothetical protein